MNDFIIASLIVAFMFGVPILLLLLIEGYFSRWFERIFKNEECEKCSSQINRGSAYKVRMYRERYCLWGKENKYKYYCGNCEPNYKYHYEPDNSYRYEDLREDKYFDSEFNEVKPDYKSSKLLKKNKMRVPRIFKYIMWFLVTIVVAKFAFNIERIVLFLIDKFL